MPYTLTTDSALSRRFEKHDDAPVHAVLKGGGLMKPYTSFAEYALESSKSTEPLPLPLVTPLGQMSLMSIPLITIIGVQVITAGHLQVCVDPIQGSCCGNLFRDHQITVFRFFFFLCRCAQKHSDV